MMLNSTKMLFLLFLFIGSFISISSNNWLGSWMGLEINLISFLPLIHDENNFYSSESSMKYFIIQSMSSTIMLFGFILSSFEFYYFNCLMLIMMSLLIKMGSAPFHMWIPGMMEGLSWKNCFLLSTWQKIAVLYLFSYVIINWLLMVTVILSLFFGCIGGINQSSMKKIMGYSSINNLGWILISMTITNLMWFNFFFWYSFIIFGIFYVFNKFKINYLNQLFFGSYSSFDKIYFCMMMFSLGGLPPMLGFMPKWLVIQSMVFQENYMICVFMLITSLITLFYYIRLCSLIILINSLKLKFNNYFFGNFITYLWSFVNLFGFMIIIIFKSLI